MPQPPSQGPPVLVARQPILDRDADVVAYELLARASTGAGGWTGGTDDSRTTVRILGQSFLDMDVWSITEGLPAFVNFTRDLLLSDGVASLPPALTVIEVVETVPPDEQVRDACHRLRAAGYRIALDDVVGDDPRLALLPDVDVVKVDFAATSTGQRAGLVARCHEAGVQVLAEKVETPAQHDEALRLGCDLFQGYFFQRPVLVGSAGAGMRLLHLQLLRSVAGADIDRDAIGGLLARDPAAAARVRRLWDVVTGAPRPVGRPEVTGPGTNDVDAGAPEVAAPAPEGAAAPDAAALRRLDDRTLARLITVVVAVWLGERRPRPLLDTVLIRARFCEHLVARSPGAGRRVDGWLVGLCSLLDALVGAPLDEVLRRIRLPAVLVAACRDGRGPLAPVLHLARAYERGAWPAVREGAELLGIDGGTLAPLYLDCLAWARAVRDAAGAATGRVDW